MKCSKCGAEIDAGSVFCKKCGEPVQMVPDYNILEDDFLISLLEEEKADLLPPGERRVSAKYRDESALCGGHRYGERLSADFFLGKRIFYLLEGISGIREKIQQLLGQQYLPDSGKEGEEA